MTREELQKIVGDDTIMDAVDQYLESNISTLSRPKLNWKEANHFEWTSSFFGEGFTISCAKIGGDRVYASNEFRVIMHFMTEGYITLRTFPSLDEAKSWFEVIADEIWCRAMGFPVDPDYEKKIAIEPYWKNIDKKDWKYEKR